MSSSTFLNNPLPPLWETFQTLQDALKMANRAIPAVHLRVAGKPEGLPDWTRGFSRNAIKLR